MRDSMKIRDKPISKKAYHRPRLLVYGDLHGLTQATGFQGKFDNPAKTLKFKS